MRRSWRTWLQIGKWTLAAVILFFIIRQFTNDLSRLDLREHVLRPHWLVLSGVLYLAGLGLSCWYWQRLLIHLGQRPTLNGLLRAYYIGHLGKYVPGKAWALLLRATLIAGRGVRVSVAGLTAFYEVLTTMAAGALLAAALFAACGPTDASGLDWEAFLGLLQLQTPVSKVLDRQVLVLLALLVVAMTLAPILPPVFNRIVGRFKLPAQPGDTQPLPPLRTRDLVEGLALTAVGWLVLGLSLWCALEGTLPEEVPWSWPRFGLFAAILALAYVAGFVILLVPGGLGVREFFLTLLLLPELERLLGVAEDQARGQAVLLALVLRLVWTAAEVVFAGAVYWLPAPAPPEPPERKTP